MGLGRCRDTMYRPGLLLGVVSSGTQQWSMTGAIPEAAVASGGAVRVTGSKAQAGGTRRCSWLCYCERLYRCQYTLQLARLQQKW